MTREQSQLDQIKCKVRELHEIRDRDPAHARAYGWDDKTASRFVRDIALICDLPFLGEAEPKHP